MDNANDVYRIMDVVRKVSNRELFLHNNFNMTSKEMLTNFDSHHILIMKDTKHKLLSLRFIMNHIDVSGILFEPHVDVFRLLPNQEWVKMYKW
jgi:hypothetical protein